MAISELKFVTAWRRDNPQYAADAQAYWERTGLIAEADEREERVSELCALAYSGSTVVAVSTAELVVIPGLRQRFAMCRSSVDPEYRRGGVGAEMTGYYRTILEAWAIEHQEEKVMGVGVAMVSNQLLDKQRDPLWLERGIDMAVVGYLSSGEQLRIGWFRHARI